jgi:hypothetical protein
VQAGKGGAGRLWCCVWVCGGAVMGCMANLLRLYTGVPSTKGM